jgi:hypothetical protein
MNEKTAKAVRRSVRRMMAGRDWPKRAYYLLPEGTVVLEPACERSLYKIAKAVARDVPRRKLG